MPYRRTNFPSAHFLGYLLPLLISTLLLWFIDSVTGKAIPLPFPFPADNPPPDTSYNPPPPEGALPIPADPVKDINKDWFLSYLTKNQPENNCVFYCRITRAAREWVKENPPLRTIWETYPAKFFETTEEPRKFFYSADLQAGTKIKPVYQNRNRYAAMSSEAYAERCLGTTVHLLLDEDIGVPEQCIWNSEEKVALLREPNPIQKVIEITFKAGTFTEKSRREYALAEDEPASPSSSPTGEPWCQS